MTARQLVAPGGVQPHSAPPHRLVEGDWSLALSELTHDRPSLWVAERCLASRVPSSTHLIEGGESEKRIERLEELVSELITRGLTREHVVVAIGGGATTDLVGFAAAVALRGVDWVAVPTTLLAAVDASIGGKTAVNSPLGKNLLGAFHQPLAAVIDPSWWETLPPSAYRSAAAEILKVGLLRPELLQRLRRCEDAQAVARLAHEAAQVKLDVVAADPHERGARMALNLGHTLGHALERQGRGRLSHGEAVAIGLVAVLRLSHPDAEALIRLMARWGLPTNLPDWAREDELIPLMRRDKKASSTGLRVVLPSGDGACHVVESFDPQRLIRALSTTS